MLLVAAGESGRTLSGVEESLIHQHVAGCEACRAVIAGASGARPRAVASVDAPDAPDEPDLRALPTVDPALFTRRAELAHGGMGRITRARDRRLGRDVAIKEVLAPILRARFEREAMLTARLQHPAIVPIYEAGAWPDGSAFYAMRLVAGGTLADAIARATTLEDRLALLPHVTAVTEALGYAHAQRVVHRDLKPANVLVGEFGETVVIDWGLAKELDLGAAEPDAGDSPLASPELTRVGAVVGTPCFLAPEQAAGGAVDERADVYALGAILYTLLAGDPPHWDIDERSADRLIAAAVAAPPTPIAQRAPHAPADLRAIVERAMARDPAARYPSAKQMAEELRRFQTGQLLGSRTYTTRELVVRWIRRHRTAVAVGAVALGVLAIVGVVSLRQIVASEHATRLALAESQLEQGRQLVLDGDPARAMPYLTAALATRPDDPVAHRLATIARRDVSRRLGSFAGTAAAFNARGDQLAIAQADGTIALIDPATARPLRTLPATGEATGRRIAALAYAPDGARLAVAAAGGAFVVDLASGQPTELPDTAAASELVFLPDGRLALVSAGAVTLAGPGGTPPRVAHVDAPRSLVASHDGAYLAALTRDGAVAWRADTLEPAVTLQAPGVARYGVAFDHGQLITSGEDGVRRWDAASRTTATFTSSPIGTLSWIDDHTLLADGLIIRADTGAVEPLGVRGIQASTIIDSTHVLTGGYDHTLRIWDLDRAARPLVVLDASTATDTLIVDPVGRHAVSLGVRSDPQIELWNVAPRDLYPARRVCALGVEAGATCEPRPGAPTSARIKTIVTDHHDRFAVVVQDGDVQVTQLVSMAPPRIVATLRDWPVGFRPDHDQLAVIGGDGVLAIYDSRTGQLRDKLEQPDQIWLAAFSGTGATIATGSDHQIVLRGADGRVDGAYQPLVTPPGTAKFSAIALDDQGHVVTGHADGSMKLWDARTGACLRTITSHTATLSAIELRGDSFVSHSWDGTLRRWAFPSGDARGSFKAFSEAAMSPDAQRIASVDGSSAVSLWDTAQDRLLEQLPTSDRLAAVAFVDDDHLVVGGEGARLELIDLREPRSLGIPAP
jgi:WD40 repeat protein/tRNA A-37 threonylcarbamoyl transferase component Bud32